MSAPADARAWEMTNAGLLRLAALGQIVRRMPQGQSRRTEWPKGFRAPIVEKLIRYDTNQRWDREARTKRKVV